MNSLPPFQRDSKLESFDSYTQLDFTINSKQTANVSVSFYPQQLNYLGLNTFNTQASTPDFHQRGYQSASRTVPGRQLRFADFSVQLQAIQRRHNGTKRRSLSCTARNHRRWILQSPGTSNIARRLAGKLSLCPWKFAGSHQFIVGLSYEHSQYDGRQTFLPVEFDGVSNLPVERITYTSPTSFDVSQNETAWFVGDQWAITPRLTVGLGLRFDNDTITNSTHAAPRVGFLLALTSDGKTLLKGGIGRFYDRVPLMAATFPDLPNRTVSILGQNGQPTSPCLTRIR